MLMEIPITFTIISFEHNTTTCLNYSYGAFSQLFVIHFSLPIFHQDLWIEPPKTLLTIVRATMAPHSKKQRISPTNIPRIVHSIFVVPV